LFAFSLGIKMSLTKAQKRWLQHVKEVEGIIDAEQRALEEERLRLAETCQHPDELIRRIDCILCRKRVKACPHPDEAISTFQWEHDNGYGRQSMQTGYHCDWCGAEKRWESSHLWYTPEDRARFRNKD
jgi:hypothetical protein